MDHYRCWTTRVKMAIPTSLATFVLCLGILQSVDAACTDTIMQSAGYNECVMGYATFMSNTAGDVAQMCSAEGKAEMKCISDYMNQCPELATMKGNEHLSGLGQMDAMCGTLGGGGNGGAGNGACAQAQTCMSGMAGMANAEGSTDNGSGTDLSMFQSQVAMICGPMKDVFMCLEKVEGECPQMKEGMEQNMKMGSMGFEKIKGFMKKYCSSIPSDFGTNACVKEQLQSAKNNECFTEIGKSTDQPTCSDYNELLECVPLEKCGSKYENSLRQVMSFFISAMSSTKCDLTTSTSYPLRASFFTVFTAVLMLFKLI